MLGVSVAEYTQEFLRLSKYASYVIPTEAARVERFRAGLIAPLYKNLLAMEFTTLSKLIDKAKLWEIRDKEERQEREQMRQSQMRGQGSRTRTEENRPYKKFKNWPKHSAPQSHYRGGMRRNQPRNNSAPYAPRPAAMSEKVGSVAPGRTTCATYGKEHRG